MVEISYSPLSPLNPGILQGSFLGSPFSIYIRHNANPIVSEVLLWLPRHGRRSRGRLAKTFVDQLMEDTSCNYEELSNAMMNREEWRVRVNQCRSS